MYLADSITIQLCADDYGQSWAISRAICNLIENNRLSATSCLVDTKNWKQQAAWLKPLHHKADIGLHFNLTENFGCAKTSSLIGLMIRSQLRQLNIQTVLKDLDRQWNLFVQEMGFVPDFIDGHQHVHQFPVIRNVLFDFLDKKRFKGWVRSTYPAISAPSMRFKANIINWLGGITVAKWRLSNTRNQGKHFSYTTNTAFAGVYDFSSKQVYRDLMQTWLKQAKQGMLIMCHPSDNHIIVPSQTEALSEALLDRMSFARQAEYDYLISEAFLQDCLTYNVAITKASYSDTPIKDKG